MKAPSVFFVCPLGFLPPPHHGEGHSPVDGIHDNRSGRLGHRLLIANIGADKSWNVVELVLLKLVEDPGEAAAWAQGDGDDLKVEDLSGADTAQHIVPRRGERVTNEKVSICVQKTLCLLWTINLRLEPSTT